MSDRLAIVLTDTLPADIAAPGGGTVDDQVEFSMLPAKAQTEVLAWDGAMREMKAARRGAQQHIQETIARRFGRSAKLVRVKYDRWLAEGWRGLVNRSKFKGQTLPQAFVQDWLRKCEAFQRRTCVKQAWRMLMQQLAAWERGGGMAGGEFAIPGYHTPPRRLRGSGLPAGWHYATLCRIAARHAEKKARQQGPKSFSDTMPSVLGSREGCEAGQFLFFDDETLDVLVNFVGNNTAMRPNAFHCLDYLSGCNIGRGFKPVIQEGNSRRTVSSNLTKQDFDWFVLYILTVHGWNDRTGTVLCGEMGTACLSDWMQDALPRVFGTKVKWDHSGRFGEPMRGMIYEGQSSGNFRFKAPLESWFNIERNWMASLPGNTGRNRDEAPEENYGLLRESAWFLKQLERLPLERRLMLRSNCMEWHSFVDVANQMVEWINRRTDHTLGQWEKLGFVRPAILDTLTGDPAVMQRLLSNPAALAALTAADPRLRRMSPREVWDSRAPALRRLAPWQVSSLMPVSEARPVKVTGDRVIRISDRALDSEPMEFNATHCADAAGRHIMLRPGDEFLAFLNPYAAHEIQLCEPAGPKAGAWIGTCAARLRDSRADTEALMKQYGRIRGDMAPVLADIAERASSESNRRSEDRAVNRRLADRKPLGPAEEAAAAAADGMRAVFAGEAAAEGPGEEEGADNFRSLFGAD